MGYLASVKGGEKTEWKKGGKNHDTNVQVLQLSVKKLSKKGFGFVFSLHVTTLLKSESLRVCGIEV